MQLCLNEGRTRKLHVDGRMSEQFKIHKHCTISTVYLFTYLETNMNRTSAPEAASKLRYFLEEATNSGKGPVTGVLHILELVTESLRAPGCR